MNEIQTLQTTINLWQWRYRNPNKMKHEWYMWDNPVSNTMTYHGKRISGNCFLCDFYSKCTGCPLSHNNHATGCDTNFKWTTSDTINRKLLAKEIISRCQIKIKEVKCKTNMKSKIPGENTNVQ